MRSAFATGWILQYVWLEHSDCAIDAATRRVGSSAVSQFLIVVRYIPSANDPLQRLLPPCQLLSQIVREEAIELTIEIEDPQVAHALPQKLIGIDGVLEASVVNYNGEHLPS